MTAAVETIERRSSSFFASLRDISATSRIVCANIDDLPLPNIDDDDVVDDELLLFAPPPPEVIATAEVDEDLLLSAFVDAASNVDEPRLLLYCDDDPDAAAAAAAIAELLAAEVEFARCMNEVAGNDDDMISPPLFSVGVGVSRAPCRLSSCV